MLGDFTGGVSLFSSVGVFETAGDCPCVPL